MRQTIFTDPTMTQFQQAINDQFAAVGNIPIVSGVLLENVKLDPASGNQVSHKLGRTARGYVIVSKSNGASVWNGAFTDKIIPFQVSAAVTLSIWVF